MKSMSAAIELQAKTQAGKAAKANQSSDKVLKTLNDVWKMIQKNVPEVEDVFVVVASARTNKQAAGVYGHYAPSTWGLNKDTAPEMLLSSTVLRLDGAAILKTMLHEAAHSLARVRGIKETSRQNRYHNKRFVEMSNVLGLVWPTGEDGKPEKPDSVIGYSQVVLTDETKNLYKKAIALLDALPLTTGRTTYRQVRQGPKRVRVQCGCTEGTDEYVSFGQTVWEKINLPLICGECERSYYQI